MKLLLLLLPFLLTAAARAQSDFHAYPGTMKSHESGQMEILTVVSGNQQFKILPPKGWYRQVDEASRKLIFTSLSGRSAVTIQLTANFPGELPDKDVLRDKVLQAHAGARILRYSVFATGSQPGVFFDLERAPAPRLVQKIRHVYVAQATGLVEFVLSAGSEEFDQYLPLIMGMSRGFRLDPLKATKP
jgi:hypothetical protein